MIIELNYTQITDLLLAIEIVRANPKMRDSFAADVQKLLEEKLPDALNSMVDDYPEEERANVLKHLRKLEEIKYNLCQEARDYRSETETQIGFLKNTVAALTDQFEKETKIDARY